MWPTSKDRAFVSIGSAFMGTMLIIKAVLILGVVSGSQYLAVSSTATSENPVTSTTAKTKRDFTTPSSSVNWSTETNNYQEKKYNVPHTSTSIPQEPLEAETTVKTIIAQNPSQSVTYNPFQYYDGNSRSQNGRSGAHGQFLQTTQPSLQGGFQAIQDPRLNSANNGFQKTSTPYNPQSSQRIQNKLTSNVNQNSQYFSNPSSYRLHSEPSNKVAPQITLSSYSTSGGGQNFPKFKSGPSARPNRQSSIGFGSFDVPSKFRFNPSTAFNVQTTPLLGSAQRSKNTIYKSNSYSIPKNLEITPASFSSELSEAPSFKSFNKLGENYQYAGTPSVGYSNKQVTIPDSIQFQNSQQVSGLIQAFENEPVLLSTGLDYQVQPSSGLSFDFPKSSPASLPAVSSNSFSSPIGNYQPRVLPVHSSSSTAQLPQYKGASVNAFANNEYTKPDGGYQLLANQPQLHFTSGTPLQSVGAHQPVIYHSNKPFEQIRTDAEVLNKKRPKPDDSYELDFDGDFKVGKDIGHFAAETDDVSAPVKSPIRDISFELPSSNLFNSYDEAFGKYSKLASLEQDKSKVNSKPGYLIAEDDDDDKEDKSGEYRSSYTEGRIPSVSSYEDEDEEESRRSERLETRNQRDKKKDEDDEDDDDDDVSDTYKSYGVDFEKDFEESYRKELPKNDYVHIKEVPEIEESTSESKKRSTNRNRPKTSRGGTKEKSRHVVQGEYEEPKEYESYTTHKYEKPKTTYRDSEGHGSRTTFRKTKNSEPASEESYGNKVSRDRGTTRYTKSDDSETRTTDAEQQQTHSRKSSANTREINTPNRSYNSPKQTSSNVQRSLSPTLSPIELIKTFTFPPFTSAKTIKQPSTGKQVSRATDSYGAPTLRVQAFVNHEEQSYRLPQLQHREGLRYFTNGQVVRDLTGI